MFSEINLVTNYCFFLIYAHTQRENIRKSSETKHYL